MPNTYFDNNKTIFISFEDNTSATFSRLQDEQQFLKVRSFIKEGDWDSIKKLLLTPEAITFKFNNQDFHISNDGVVSINGATLPSSLSKVIVALYKEDAPIEPLINFWNKLQSNPSNRLINSLYNFIDRNNITLFPDGDLLLYRVVRKTNTPGTYVDIYTGKMVQSIGDTLSISRSSVDDRDEVSCSHGLHVCAFSYTNHYGNVHSGEDVVVNVKVNPVNIVSNPTDYNCAKLRVCEFTIVEENTTLTEVRQAYYTNWQSTGEDYYDDQYEDEDYEDEEDDYYRNNF